MVSINLIAILGLAALTSAAPTSDAGLNSFQARESVPCSVPAGVYTCAGIIGSCNSCAIGVGQGNGQCALNNVCASRDGSCVIQNGQPYCV